MASVNIESARTELLELGYTRIPRVLTPDGVKAIREASERLLGAAPPEHFEKNRTTGSMLSVAQEPAFADIIAWPRTLEIIRRMAFGQLAWSAGYVINKPAGGPRLFWHQDWLWWTHPVSADAVPHQIFAMFYLVDTDRSNGCLRVMPGSHRRHVPLHDVLLRAHSPAALSGAADNHPMYGDADGEVDVPVQAGDLLLGDARLLHAAHANRSSDSRTLITLWYHPAYDRLPGALQGHLADTYGGALGAWPVEARNRIDCALPYRTGHEPAWAICRDPQFVAPARAVAP